MTYYTDTAFLHAATPRAGRRTTTLEWLGAAMAVLMVITFSQGWISPVFGANADPSSGGMIRTLYFPAYLAGLTLLAMNAGDTVRVLIRQPLLIAMMGLAAASITWSISPDETLRRVVAIGFTTLAGVALAARFTWPKLVELLSIGFGLLCVLSLLVCVAVPHIGRMPADSEFPGAWRGLWADKNALGDNMALFMPAFIAAAVIHPRRRKLWVGVAVLALALCLLSTSKTSLLGMMLVFGAAIFVALVRRGPAMGVIMTYLAVLVVAAAIGAVIVAPAEVFALLGKDPTLTGRTQIWAAIMTQVQNHPWLGHGYGTVWTDESPWSPLAWIIKDANFRPRHAHSSWYEQLLGLGYVGLTAWVLFYAQTMVTGVVSAFREKGAFLALPFLVVYSLISLTESITMTYNDLRWVMFVAIACKLAYPDRYQDRV